MIGEKAMRRQEVPDTVPSGPASVIGMVATAQISEGELLRADLLRQKSGELSFAVPAGKRAVTVALDPIIGVAGFIKPGNRVDVLATFNVNDGSITKMILENQLLLAVGANPITKESKPGKEAAPETTPTATLAVTPSDANVMVLAESKGKLRLALRGVQDSGEFTVSKAFGNPGAGVTSRALIGFVPPDVSKPAAVTLVPASGSGKRTRMPEVPPAPEEKLQPAPVALPFVDVVRGSQAERVVVNPL